MFTCIIRLQMGVKFSSGMLKQQPNKIIHVLMVELHNFLFRLFIVIEYIMFREIIQLFCEYGRLNTNDPIFLQRK